MFTALAGGESSHTASASTSSGTTWPSRASKRRQDDALRRAADVGDGAVVADDPQRPEHPEVHGAPRYGARRRHPGVNAASTGDREDDRHERPASSSRRSRRPTSRCSAAAASPSSGAASAPSIVAIALAYPEALVDGFDDDGARIDAARGRGRCRAGDRTRRVPPGRPGDRSGCSDLPVVRRRRGARPHLRDVAARPRRRRGCRGAWRRRDAARPDPVRLGPPGRRDVPRGRR